MSLLRCSISSAVIGSPLTTTTTCWAWTAVAASEAVSASRVAANSLRNVVKASNIVTPSTCSAMNPAPSVVRAPRRSSPRSNCPRKTSARLMRAAERPGSRTESAGSRICARAPTERAQAHLHHIGVVDRYAAAIGIACNVVQGQDEAVVDISDADLGLRDRFGVNIVSRSPHQHPVWIHLQPCKAEDALATVEEADQRLGSVVAVHHGGGPTAEVGDGLELGPLQREVVLGEPEPRREGQGGTRLVRCPRHVVRLCGIEAAVETGVGGPAEREGVQPVELVGLPEQDIHVAAAIELGGVLNADVRPAAAFHAIPTGELVHLEQIRIVEDQALCVLVGERADIALVRPQDELSDR